MVFPLVVPQGAERWGDLTEEEVGVFQRQLMGHRADLEQHHEVAYTQCLAGLLELIAYCCRAATNDELIIDKIFEPSLLQRQVLLRNDRIAQRIPETSIVLVARGTKPLKRNVQQLVVEVLDMLGTDSPLSPGGGDHPALDADRPEAEGLPADDPAWLERCPWLADLLPVPDDATWPRIMSAPHVRATGSYGPEMAAWAEHRTGKPLRWWQKLVVYRLLEHDEAGALVWETLVMTMARQLGKSWLLRELFLWRIHQAQRFGEPQLVLHTGKDLAICKEVQRSARRWAKEQGGYKVREVNGQEEICFVADDSRWMVRAREGVYGYSASLAGVDEAWKCAASVVDEGLEPTMTERTQPQLVLVSTAHRLTTHLMPARRAGAIEELADPDLVLIIEWSAPRSADLDDIMAWRMASPHWTPRRERLIATRLDAALVGETDDPDEPDPIEAFRAQWLNQWPIRTRVPKRNRDEALLPAGVWRGCQGDLPTDGPLILAVEDWYGQGAAAAAVSTADDGRFLVGGWCFARWSEAYEWVAGWCELHPGSRVLVGASMAGDPGVKDLPATVAPVGRLQTPSALATFRELVSAGRVVQDGSTDLAEQVNEVRVAMGPSGLRVVDGRSDLVRCATWALQAAEHARYAARVGIF